MECLITLDAQLVLNSIHNGIVATDSNAKITHFNRTAERIFNIPAHKAIKRPVMKVLPHIGSKLLESLKTGKPFYGEKVKGEKVTLISNLNPIISSGKVSGVVIVFQDISEFENISKELALLKTTKNWLDAIIDSSYDGLWITDREGTVVRINKASERINNVRADEVIGKNMTDLVAEGLCDKSVTAEVLKKNTAVTMIQNNKGGKKFLVTGNPIFNERGEISFVVTNERDISELDHLRNQLQEAHALAKGYISKLSELEMKGIDSANVIFRSEEMHRVLEIALRVAEVDSTVLLLGESGVGKSMIAKLIHKHSQRSKGPFIRVDCAGIPDSLIESELFGYEKGAFTGARSEGKPGFFELANNGTLFLDEIGEIPLSSQSKLLRFLEDHEIVRVGGIGHREINVRIITATNSNIEKMVSSRLFREDLYYRLNVVSIYIPPLRQRQDDVIPLVSYYLRRFNETYRKERSLSPEVMEVLCTYDFPGNVRELANLIERLVVVAENDRIEVTDLPNSIAVHGANSLPLSFLSEILPLRDIVDRVERVIIQKTIKKYGSQREAARILKVDQATISRKSRKYGVQDDVILHKG